MGTNGATRLSPCNKWDFRNELEEKSLAQWGSGTVCRKGQSRDVAPGGRAQKGPSWSLAPGSALGPQRGPGTPEGLCGSWDSSRGHKEQLQPLQQRPFLRSDVLHSEQTFFPPSLLPFYSAGPLPVTSCPYSKPCHSTHVPLNPSNSTEALPFPLLPLLPWLFLSRSPHLTVCVKGEMPVGWLHLQCLGHPQWQCHEPALPVLTTGFLGAGTIISWVSGH